MNRMLKKQCNTERGRVGIAFVITLVFFLLIYWKSNIVFFTNDDENIMYTLAGYYTNGIPGDHSFVNYLLGWFIGTMYTLLPSVPWYGLFHVTVLFLSIVVIGRSLLKEAMRSDISPIVAIGLFSGIVILCFSFPVILMQFTVTSAMAGTAAVVLLLTADVNLGRRGIGEYVLSVLFMVICYCHRKNTGNVILCFYALTAAYRFAYIYIMCRKQKRKLSRAFVSKPVVALIVALVLIGLAVFISEGLVRTTDEWEAFYEYDNARFKVTDYAHDTYWQNKELYKEMGWTGELYRLACSGYLFFMDSRVNAQSFDAISATGYQATQSSLMDCIVNFKTLIGGENLALVCLIIMFVFFVFIFLMCLIHLRRNYLEVLLALCAVGGASVMVLYLCWKGRFILRAFQTISYPTIMILAVLVLRMMRDINVKRWNKVVTALLVVVAIALGAITLQTGYQLMCEACVLAQQRVDKSNRTHMVEEYAIQNPDNMYIYDTSLTFRYSPFITYVDRYPSNLSYWGGMGWNSPTLLDQAEQNGIDKMYADIFFNDDVYYVSYSGYKTGSGERVIDLFYNYMVKTYGDVTINKVEDITTEIAVYKVTRNTEN